ncbi:MAG TPA: hypothetical protein VGN14_14450 [Candidatus Elarobacter sp.]|jgi:hypothetical protein
MTPSGGRGLSCSVGLRAELERDTIGVVLHAVSVYPVRIRLRSDELSVDALRGVGFRWVCSCGERGRVERSVRLARAAGKEHRAGAPT